MDRLEQWARHPHNVRFADLCHEAERYGFSLIRVRGSHHQFARDDVPEILTLNPGPSGKVVPAQVRKLKRIVEGCGLTPRE